MPRLTGFARVPIHGPKRLPVIGTPLNAFRFVADPVGRLLALRAAHGHVAAVLDQSPAIVCAFGAERNREVLTNGAVFRHDEDFLRASPGSSLERLSLTLVFMNGDAHKRHRRLLQPSFHKGSLAGYAEGIVAVTEAMLSRWAVGQTADVSVLLRELALGVAMRCFFGLDFADTSQLGRMAAEMVEKISSPMAFMLPYAIPGTPFHRARRLADRVEKVLRDLIEKKRRRSAAERDALAIMIHAHHEEGSTFSDDELVAEANGLFIAGHETTAKTLAWTLFLLEQHPNVLADVLDEIDATLRGGPPTVDQLPKLVLLDRVIKESMRLLPAAPMLFPRVCAAEVGLGPYTLPEGATVVLSPLVTHREPDVFPEPTRFRPERWESLQPGPYEYLPFGAGPRMCIGAAFAAMALRLMLPIVLRRYRLALVPGADVSRQCRTNILGFRHGLPMRVVPQDRRFTRESSVRGDIHELVDLSP